MLTEGPGIQVFPPRTLLALSLLIAGAPVAAARAEEPASPAPGAAERAPAGAAPGTSAPGSLAPDPPPGSRELPEALRPRPSLSGQAAGAGAYALAAGESVGITLVIMGWNRWVGEAPWAEISAASIGRNLRGGWHLDDDQFWVNQFGHPYQGMWTHTAARSAGLGFWASTPYTFTTSLAWEIVGETQPPAINDQITTPIAGTLLGEVIYRLAAMLRQDGSDPWRDAGAAILSPMSAVNRGLVGDRFEELDEPLSWRLSAGPVLARIPWDPGAPAPGWERSPTVAYRVDHGLAWHPALRLERPLDHFQLEAGYGGRVNPAARLLVRGLLAGTTYGGPGGWRGLFGLYGGFDLDTPGVFRVSTSSLGVGTSGGAPLGRRLGVEATAVLSGVLLGGAGQIGRGPDGKGRDYVMGPGAQAALEAQLSAVERATLRLGLREYLVLGVGDIAGTELVGTLSAEAVVQIAGGHGVGVEATLWHRESWQPEAGRVDQLGRAVRLFWAVSGFHAPARALAADGSP